MNMIFQHVINIFIISCFTLQTPLLWRPCIYSNKKYCLRNKRFFKSGSIVFMTRHSWCIVLNKIRNIFRNISNYCYSLNTEFFPFYSWGFSNIMSWAFKNFLLRSLPICFNRRLCMHKRYWIFFLKTNLRSEAHSRSSNLQIHTFA